MGIYGGSAVLAPVTVPQGDVARIVYSAHIIGWGSELELDGFTDGTTWDVLNGFSSTALFQCRCYYRLHYNYTKRFLGPGTYTSLAPTLVMVITVR